MSDLTPDIDTSSAGRHDAEDRRQPQAGAFMLLLRGKKRLEQVREHIGIHPASGVGHGQFDILPQRQGL